MTATERRAISREIAELAAEFKGDSTPYARGYRAAVREAQNVISRFVKEESKND